MTQFEQECQTTGQEWHAPSLTYKETFQTPLHFLDHWEQNLRTPLSTVVRSKIFTPYYRSSSSNKYQESGYKIETRWYCIPSILSSCWRYFLEPGDILHIFWSYPAFLHTNTHNCSKFYRPPSTKKPSIPVSKIKHKVKSEHTKTVSKGTMLCSFHHVICTY